MSKLILANTMPSAGEGACSDRGMRMSLEVAGAKDVTLETFKTLFFLRNREGLTAAEQCVVGSFFLATKEEPPNNLLALCNFAARPTQDCTVCIDQIQLPKLVFWDHGERSIALVKGGRVLKGRRSPAEDLVVNVTLWIYP